MTPQDLPTLVGRIVEDEDELEFDELCRFCSVDRSFVVELVEQGVIETRAPGSPRFSGKALQRVRIATRLRRDLGVNAAGSALVIELLERIETLERGREG